MTAASPPRHRPVTHRAPTASPQVTLHNPGRFFNELFHRLLWEPSMEVRLLAMHGMALTYQNYHASIGPFPGTSHVVTMLRTCTHRAERDRLLLLTRSLLANAANAKPFISSGGLHVLVSLLVTVHMETERSAHSQVLQTNLLTTTAEAAPEAKQWYVRAADPAADAKLTAAEIRSRRTGPLSMSELVAWLAERGGPAGHLCWEKGMGEGGAAWLPPEQVPQVAWAGLASGVAILSYTHLGGLVLDLFLALTGLHPTRADDGSLIHPMPTPKRALSTSAHMPHLVQLLLTMEPSIVERAAVLLTRLVEDNPLLPRLYLTGAFFFALMYTGSNVAPIVRFLRAAHLSQLYRDEESGNDQVRNASPRPARGTAGRASRLAPSSARRSTPLLPARHEQVGLSGRSFLCLMLPQAMVCCLEAHGADKFTEVRGLGPIPRRSAASTHSPKP